jgi:hypothetical protein
MEIAGVLAIFFLAFAGIMFLLIRRVWRRYRMIAVTVPCPGDFQAFSYKLTESIRSLNFREVAEAAGSGRVFRAPGWMKWTVGLQDISVEPAGSGAVVVTGPGFWVASIGRGFAGAAQQPYHGRQPVWPLLKGGLRLMGSVVLVVVASGVVAYLFAGR